MREQAHRQGAHFLDPFDVYVGNPFSGRQEWEYCAQVGDLRGSLNTITWEGWWWWYTCDGGFEGCKSRERPL
jgi:hypothetical protein